MDSLNKFLFFLLMHQKKIIEDLKSTYAMLPGHVYLKDINGVYLWCNNEQATALNFKSYEELIGKTDYDLSEKELADQFWAVDQAVMQKKTTIEVEEKILKDGKEAITLTRKAPVFDVNHNVIGVLGTSFDITDRKKMEAELKEAKSKAEVANEAKSEFLRNMEHQLRTPFSGVYSMVQILAESETDSQKKQMLEMTYQSAKEFLELLNNIIDFSRYQVDKGAVLAKKMDLRKTIEKAVTMERAAAAIKKLELIYEYPEDIPTIFFSDENRIERIILNLLSNAIKFTDEGSIHIQVKLVKILDDKNLILQIIVSDTGIGIPHDKQELIYEKFYRGSPANQNKYAGAGLGLHIVKQLIEDLEGEIEVVSSPNKGTVFTCTFPFKRPLVDEITDNDGN